MIVTAGVILVEFIIHKYVSYMYDKNSFRDTTDTDSDNDNQLKSEMTSVANDIVNGSDHHWSSLIVIVDFTVIVATDVSDLFSVHDPSAPRGLR